MPGLDNQPELDMSADDAIEKDTMPPNDVVGAHGSEDREGAMAKADLYKLANYSHKLYQQLQDDTQLEAWVQAKITKAADYIASVYHYLAYEMKFTEYAHHLDNSDTLSEGQKQVLKTRLMEAKMKMKEIKKAQAEKMKKDEKIDESMVDVCGHCGGAGHVEKKIPEEVKAKVEKYNRLMKATKAAHKRMDANHNGIPDDEESELEENFDGERGGDQDTPSKFNKQQTSPTSTRYTRKSSTFSDEHDGGSGTKSHAKAKDSATKKAEKSNDIKLPKHTGNTWGMKGGEKFGKKMEEAAEKKADKDYDQDGKIESGKDEYLGSRIRAAKKAGKLKEGTCSVCKKDPCVCKKEKKCNECGMFESKCKCSVMESDRTMSRAAKGMMKYGKDGMKALAKAGKEGKSLEPVKAKYNKYDESLNEDIQSQLDMLMKAYNDAKAKGDQKAAAQWAADYQKLKAMQGSTPVKEGKPSAGLSKAKKSATVKKAKAGGDIGKPGKGFKALAKKAGGGEKGEKIAAAAMWKNIKETTAYVMEKSKAAKPDYIDLDKDGNKSEPMKKAAKDAKKETVKESTEVDRMRELTGRLNRAEKPAIVENREVDQIRELTRKLLG